VKIESSSYTGIAFIIAIAILNISSLAQAQDRIIHPNWAPKVKILRPHDITTIMGYRAEFQGKLTHAPHPGPDIMEDAAVYGFSSENDVMTWTVEAPEESEYNIALLYCGKESILSECTMEVKSGKTVIKEKTLAPTWEGKPFYQRHYLKTAVYLKKGLNTISLRLVDIPESQLAAAKKSFERKEPYRQRDHVTKHGFCIWSIELFQTKAYDDIIDQVTAIKPDLDWMAESKYGLFVHFSPVSYASYGETLLKDQYQEMVNIFDVEAFADTVAETGAAWVCLTTTHGAHYWPGPSETIDRILPGRTCKRDLIRELIDALAKHDIRLMLYYYFCPNDNKWTEAVGMKNPNSLTFVNNIESLFREVSIRYGEDLVSTAGYVDGSLWTAYQYDPPWNEWYKAIKTGNPNAPAGFSQNWGPRVSPYSDLQMTDGRGRKPVPAPEYMFQERGQFEGLQAAFWGHIDEWISRVPYHGKFETAPAYTADEYIDIFRRMDDADIPVTMNLMITSDVTRDRPFFNPASVEIMRKVKQAIKGEMK